MGVIRGAAGGMYRAIRARRLAAEARDQRFRRVNERPIEFAFLFGCVARTAPRTVLDVGTGTTALPSLLRTCGCVVTASDNVRDYWPAGMHNPHWHVADDDIRATRLAGPFDLVSCISVIEHIDDHRAAMRSMLGLLRPGGHLVLTCPYTEREYVEDAYRLPDARPEYRDLPYLGRSYSRAELDGWLALGGELVEAEYWETFAGPCNAVGADVSPPRRSSPDGPHQHACFLIRRAAATS